MAFDQPNFSYTDVLPLGPDTTNYRLITTDGVEEIDLGGQRFLKVANQALRTLSSEAIKDISHLLPVSYTHLTLPTTPYV